jgi:hypothetical protein
MQRLIFEQKASSEMEFYHIKNHTTDSAIFRCILSIEIGKVLFPEKQFHYNYQFSNLDEPSVLEKWLKNMEYYGDKYNYIIMNRNVEYYAKLQIHKFGLLRFQKRLNIQMEKQRKF